MLRIWSLFCFFITFSLQAQSIEQIRKSYTIAQNSKENTAQFYQLMQEVSSEDIPIKRAYKGDSIMMYAKYSVKNVRELLKEGKEWVEEALNKEPENIEIRLVRLSLQEHLPKIVPYHKNKDEDKKVILDSFYSQSKLLQKYLQDYIQSSKSFSPEEKKRIKN